jgi:acyl-coenzyme A synthetase/AMP-(fatty) acid ligase
MSSGGNTMDLLWEQDIPASAPAFFPLDGVPSDFGTLVSLAFNAEKHLDRAGLGPGDSVLLADSVSVEFYATILALLSRGITVLLVEPFLPLSEIDAIVARMKPGIFIASSIGKLWGIRSGSIRRIPRWTSARSVCAGRIDSSNAKRIPSVRVSADHPGVITFTSGTTGRSKGVVRTHEGLSAQNRAIRVSGDFDRYGRPDLAVFANLVLANLGMGRGTVFVPSGWKARHLKRLADLPPEWRPETLSTGPAFLGRLIESGQARDLKSIHVGGALSDCAQFERAFDHFGSNTRFLHVYGSSEAEPVAFSDARESVRLSREKGYIQTLHLGSPARGVETRSSPEGFWVTGDHVCKRYIGNDLEAGKHKQSDSSGKIWHFMGDRVSEDANGLWYQGRSFQTQIEFELEQKIYVFLGHSSAHLEADPVAGHLVLRGEGVAARSAEILRQFPQIQSVMETRIIRDRRHRSRIDRGASR